MKYLVVETDSESVVKLINGCKMMDNSNGPILNGTYDLSHQ